jgi:uncharacterized membrane protein
MIGYRVLVLRLLRSAYAESIARGDRSPLACVFWLVFFAAICALTVGAAVESRSIGHALSAASFALFGVVSYRWTPLPLSAQSMLARAVLARIPCRRVITLSVASMNNGLSKRDAA